LPAAHRHSISAQEKWALLSVFFCAIPVLFLSESPHWFLLVCVMLSQFALTIGVFYYAPLSQVVQSNPKAASYGPAVVAFSGCAYFLDGLALGYRMLVGCALGLIFVGFHGYWLAELTAKSSAVMTGIALLLLSLTHFLLKEPWMACVAGITGLALLIQSRSIPETETRGNATGV
jgi:hypothetical protein